MNGSLGMLSVESGAQIQGGADLRRCPEKTQASNFTVGALSLIRQARDRLNRLAAARLF